MTAPVPPQYARFDGNPLKVPCPWCHAREGDPCVVVGPPAGRYGKPDDRPQRLAKTEVLKLSRAHPSRYELAGADPIPKSDLQP